jgi:hypothetical protein
MPNFHNDDGFVADRRRKAEPYGCEICDRTFPCGRQGACQRARMLPEASQQLQVRLVFKDCYLKITNTGHMHRPLSPTAQSDV